MANLSILPVRNDGLNWTGIGTSGNFFNGSQGGALGVCYSAINSTWFGVGDTSNAPPENIFSGFNAEGIRAVCLTGALWRLQIVSDFLRRMPLDRPSMITVNNTAPNMFVNGSGIIVSRSTT